MLKELLRIISHQSTLSYFTEERPEQGIFRMWWSKWDSPPRHFQIQKICLTRARLHCGYKWGSGPSTGLPTSLKLPMEKEVVLSWVSSEKGTALINQSRYIDPKGGVHPVLHEHAKIPQGHKGLGQSFLPWVLGEPWWLASSRCPRGDGLPLCQAHRDGTPWPESFLILRVALKIGLKSSCQWKKTNQHKQKPHIDLKTSRSQRRQIDSTIRLHAQWKRPAGGDKWVPKLNN